ncbi:MAG: hypothetical protein B7Y80_09405 [Hyphomicrobium sp. 32-62-53]|nr:MAG: hypothetical protein B7Y80_09405 [Hyphomicrobium sp. 32-62-53]
MANALRVKRRVSGAAGAPASLMTGELAWNQVDETLYGGKGDDGSGTATSIVALAGPGAFVDISTTQTIGGAKTFSVVPKSAQDASASTDLVRKSQVDSALAGKANTSHTHAVSDVTGLQTALDGKAAASHTHTASQISDSTLAGRALLTGADAAAQRTALGLGSAATQASSAFAAATHGHTVADVTGLQTALDGKAALASPTFTGTPAAPTAASGTNTTQIATTAFVQAAIGSFGAGDMAKATYDTDNDGKVDAAEVADAVAWTGITGKPATFAPSTHAHAISEVTGLQGALDAKAPLASPALTGTPTAPTATAGTNTTQVATTAFVAAAIAALIDAAPGALDTLNELAAALGDDPNFAATITNGLTAKLTAASYTKKNNGTETIVEIGGVSSVAGKSGAVTLVKGDVGLGNVDNTSDANKPVSTATQTALNAKANLASPTFTGTPAAPTASAGTNTTQLATTAFVLTALSGADSVPSGSVMPYAGTIEPSGWLFALGQAVSRTTYAALFAAIGTTYGAGDGSTTARLRRFRRQGLAGHRRARPRAPPGATNSTITSSRRSFSTTSSRREQGYEDDCCF